MNRWRSGVLVILGLALLLVPLACQMDWETARVAHAQTAAQPAVSQTRFEGRSGRQVNVLTRWTGPDLESFWAVLRPFIQQSGVGVSLEATPNVADILAARIEAGALPDVAIVPAGALLQHYVQSGQLVPLSQVLDIAPLANQYPAGWLELGRVAGELYGLPYRAENRSVVWYSPSEFQSRKWAVPATWQEMMALGEQIANTGLTPWSLGLRDQTGDGSAGADWIENILLRLSGPETHDRWVRHEIPWTDEAVRRAFERWGEIVGRPRQVRGGPLRALKTTCCDAVRELYQDVPGAYLCLEGSSIQPLLVRQLQGRRMEEDYDFFSLPPMRPQEDAPVLAAADVVVVFNATPQARALVRYLASREAQVMWVRRGGFIAPSRTVTLADYPDPLSRRAARGVLEASTLRFAGADQMPPAVQQAFRQATLEYVLNPSRLEKILRGVEEVAQSAYEQQPPHAAAVRRSTSTPTPLGRLLEEIAPSLKHWAPLAAPEQ